MGRYKYQRKTGKKTGVRQREHCDCGKELLPHKQRFCCDKCQRKSYALLKKKII